MGAKIIVAGFAPFEGFSANPSGDIAVELDGDRMHSAEVVGIRLEVSWRTAWPRLRAVSDEVRPAAILMLGLAPEPNLRLETLAVNRAIRAKDTEAELPPIGEDGLIDREGPPAYLSSLMFEDLWSALVEGDGIGLGIRASCDAGEYLCNYVYYLARRNLSDGVRHVGFVHVPPYPEDDPHSGIEFWRTRDAIKRIVGAIAKRIGDAS